MRLLATWLSSVLVIAVASGCAAQPTVADRCDQASGEGFEHVQVAGRERPVIVATTGDDPTVAHDLVVAFHGRTNSNAQVRRYFDLEAHAKRPTVFVYPSALPVDEPPRAWADPGDPASSLRDYALLDVLATEVAARFCLDRDRIFAVGHSLGASFANSLACARGHLLRGVATVAGGVSPSDCTGEVAALLLHHPADRLVPVGEGRRARDVFLRQNDLESAAPTTADVADFECQRWGARHPGGVLWCLHDDAYTGSGRYYPHGWPATAGEAIMAFFASLDRSPSTDGRPQPRRASR